VVGENARRVRHVPGVEATVVGALGGHGPVDRLATTVAGGESARSLLADHEPLAVAVAQVRAVAAQRPR
jgi:hypothetical protein